MVFSTGSCTKNTVNLCLRVVVGKLNPPGLISTDFKESENEWLYYIQAARNCYRKSDEVWETQMGYRGRKWEYLSHLGIESLFQIPKLDSVILPRVEDDYTKEQPSDFCLYRCFSDSDISHTMHGSPTPCGFLSYGVPTVWMSSFTCCWQKCLWLTLNAAISIKSSWP